MEELPGFLLAGLALAGSPGPAVLSLAACAAAFGPRRSLAYLAGIVLGMVGVMAITSSGVVGLLLAIPGATPVLAILAAVYFVHLAWQIATAPPLGAASTERPRPSFVTGLVLSLVNPKGYAAMAALFSGFTLLRGAPALDVAAKIAVLLPLVAASGATWLLAGVALTGLFRRPRSNRIVNVIFAVLLLVSVAAALPL
ncbi:MAG: LysE family translocator [Alphaproteobacteria bacterium]|nr:LysE family translocator [Alphaproteobacteria bacterium]MCW5739866.1 LysE family translocator [Alphaproteobacteria bacterium]